jgi:hypothetical protein
MKYIISILFCLLIVSFAQAAKPRFFLSPNLHLNIPTGDFSGKDALSEEGGAKIGAGGEADAGVVFGGTAVYVGYLYHFHDASIASSIPFSSSLKASGQWTIRRFVLGVRVPLTKGNDAPMKPMVGVGLTVGKTKAEATLSYEDLATDMDQVTRSSTGWFLEGGILARVSSVADFVGAIQYHEFDADFDSIRLDTPYGRETVSPTFSISFVTIKAGIVYKL